MPISFYVLIAIAAIVIPGLIFFGEWWNRRQGADERGFIRRPPQADQAEG